MAREPRKFWGPLDRAELPLLSVVKRVRRGGAVQIATKILSETGQHGLAWYAIGGLAAAVDEPRRDRWLRASAAVSGVYLANTGIKLVARRHRPPVAELGTPTALSFPSAHAATSFAAARLFSEIEPRAAAPLYVGALAMTSTRLHFCVHYPSDLVAGAVFGELAGRALAPLTR